jgi:hypothetical protein
MAEKPFYTFTIEAKTFGFKRPDIHQVDRYTTKARTAPASSSLEFTRELALEPEAWRAATEEKPLAALAVANGILEALGLPNV